MTSLYVNGRFLAQPLSGVQRFATEMIRALPHHWEPAALRPIILVPQRTPPQSMPFQIEKVGRANGVAWEQVDLPRRARGGLLINLGNTAPLTLSRQIIVIHDAAVFGAPESYSRKFGLWYRFMQRHVIKGGAQVVTVSEASRDEIVRYLDVPRQSIRVVSEGADHMERVDPDFSVLSRHALPKNTFVLTVGNLAVHKNLAGLRSAARMLAERNVPLVITGALNNAIFGQQDAGNFPQPARYIGRVSDGELRALYESAACFVYPTYYEGFGLTTIEAMACGCPVVASDIPALRETCRDAALFCDPFRPDDIACQIARVLDEPELASQLVMSGRRRSAELTWDRAAQSLAGIAADAMQSMA
jgi:glycosyltransferase involved in cell wall biosynthesis